MITKGMKQGNNHTLEECKKLYTLMVWQKSSISVICRLFWQPASNTCCTFPICTGYAG